jgi:hypothetical protein
MAVFSAIATAIASLGSAVGSAVSGIAPALSAAAGLVGTGISAYGAYQQAKGSKQAEALRLRQQNLEATRARRQTVRQAIIARSTALSNATSQNAAEGSGAAGGQGSIASQAASNIQGINQGQSIGMQMFQANARIAGGQTLQSIGSGIQGFGTFLSDNYATSRRVFNQ